MMKPEQFCDSTHPWSPGKTLHCILPTGHTVPHQHGYGAGAYTWGEGDFSHGRCRNTAQLEAIPKPPVQCIMQYQHDGHHVYVTSSCLWESEGRGTPKQMDHGVLPLTFEGTPNSTARDAPQKVKTPYGVCNAAHPTKKDMSCICIPGHPGYHVGEDQSFWPQAEEDPKATDSVNHPSHYTSHPSGIECITIAEHHNFNVGNALKYLWRAGLKRTALTQILSVETEDLKKARWYIDREIQRLEKQG